MRHRRDGEAQRRERAGDARHAGAADALDHRGPRGAVDAIAANAPTNTMPASCVFGEREAVLQRRQPRRRRSRARRRSRGSSPAPRGGRRQDGSRRAPSNAQPVRVRVSFRCAESRHHRPRRRHPLGNDAPSTWEAALAGRAASTSSRRSTRASSPSASRRGQGLRARRRSSSPKEARRMERYTLLALAAAKRGGRRGGRSGSIERSHRDHLRLRDRRAHRDRGAARRPARAGARPRLAVLPPARARRLGERADRDHAGDPRPELRRRLGVRDRLARDRRGGGDDQARRRRRRRSRAGPRRASTR